MHALITLSCIVAKFMTRARGKVYNTKNAREKFGTHPLLSYHTHYFGDHAQISATTPTEYRDIRTKTGWYVY